MQALPSDLTYGASYIGFNESLAPWVTSNPRIMNQNCGQTWLDTFSAVAKAGYSASNQLQAIQIVTWNDYEEGTEIETGISNCITISPSINGSSLQWTITGNENAVDHYVVFISLDGQELMNLANVAAGTHALDLSTYNLPPNTTYQLFVEAIGAPSVQNQMSASVGYMPQAQPPNAVLTLSATSGTAPLSITASTANSSSPNGSITSSTINFGDGSSTVRLAGTDSESHLQLAGHIYGHRHGNGQRWRNCFGDAAGYGFARHSNRCACPSLLPAAKSAQRVCIARAILVARRHHQQRHHKLRRRHPDRHAA